MKNKLAIPTIAILTFTIDFYLKYFINTYTEETIMIIKNFFYINKVYNTGAAFSMLDNSLNLIIVSTIIALGFIIYLIIKEKPTKTIEIVGYGLLIGGILGNLYDRIIYHMVTDYLDFIIFKYDFAVFNFADMGVVVGTALIILSAFKKGVTHE